MPALDDEPSYLETGLWEGEFQWSEIADARVLNRTLRIGPGTIRFADPVSGIERAYSVRNETSELLKTVAVSPGLIQHLPSNLRERLAALGVFYEPRSVLRRRRVLRSELDKARQRFTKHGYVQLPRLLSPVYLAWLRGRYRKLVRQSTLKFGDDQCPTRWTAHNEPAAQIFHQQLTGLVSDVAGTALKPTYSYLGSYEAGSVLPEHIDREQCEFSISMLIDYLPEPRGLSPWPLYLRAPMGVVSIRQRIGGSLLYRGRSLPHFREALPKGQTSTSVFLHFVPRNFAGTLD